MTEKTVQTGERLAVSYDITNRGQSDGEQTVELTLDGEVADSDALVLDTGEKDRMSLVTDAFTDEDDGQLYEVEIVTDDRVAQVMTIEVIDIPDSGDLHIRHDPSEDITTSDGTVTELGDLSGNGHDVTGTVSGGITTINELDAVNFDGSDDVLDGDVTDENAPYHIFAVIRFDSLVDSGSQFAMHGSLPDNNSHQMLRDTDSDFAMRADSDLNSTTYDTAIHILEMLFQPDGTTSTFVIDGTEEASGDIGDITLDRIEYAARDGSSNGDITLGEVLVYNDDKSSTESEIRSYLNDKWGVFD